MMNERMKELENEIKGLEKVNYLNRNLEKIELLRKEVKELENKIMEDLEW